MLNREAIKAQMPALVRDFVPRNCRGFNYCVFDGRPMQSTLGFPVDPHPFAGSIVAKTGEAIIVKASGKRNLFAVVDRSLATAEPDEGALVLVHPYVRRRFDGLRADTPEEEIHTRPDGSRYATQTHVLGKADAKLPIPEPRCPELKQLIEQLECLPAPDGFRRITHLLVDAGACDFTWVDPTPDRIIETPPSISFTVATGKFAGLVTVLYERGLDVYAIELARGGEVVERVDEVYFDALGQVLERLIDDGSWKRIRVDCLPGRRSVRH